MNMKSRKGVSPIVALMLILIIAVAAGLGLYGWVMGFLAAQQVVAETALVVETAVIYERESGSVCLDVYVRNIGTVDVDLEGVVVENATWSRVNYTDGWSPHDVLAPDESASLAQFEFGTAAEMAPGFYRIRILTTVGPIYGTEVRYVE